MYNLVSDHLRRWGNGLGHSWTDQAGDLASGQVQQPMAYLSTGQVSSSSLAIPARDHASKELQKMPKEARRGQVSARIA